MENKTIAAVIVSSLGVVTYSNTASATMATDASLNFNPMVVVCNNAADPNPGTAPHNCNYGSKFDSGSYFGTDANGNDIFTIDELVSIESGVQGLAVNTTQTTTGDIDQTWQFLGNPGNHVSTSDTSILSDDGAGNVTLDFSGWGWIWNTLSIDFGGGTQDCGTATDGICDIGGGVDLAGIIDNGSQIATVNCDFVCAAGEAYTLDYAATVPRDHPSSFGGVPYILHLEGTIGTVPIPSAVWLFGSGLIGLIGMARRKKA